MTRMRQILFILLILLILIPFRSVARENYYFSTIDGESGLSQSHVKAIIQDSYGFMWFGTRNKLNRFDGLNMKIFDCYDNQKRRGDNNISTLYEDPDKKLWVGTDKGVYIFDPIYEKFSFVDTKSSGNVMMDDWVADIQADNAGNIWIVIPNQGVFRYNRLQKRLKYFAIGNINQPQQGVPQCIAIEKSGKVWVGTNGTGIFMYDRAADSFTQFMGDKNGLTLAGENIFSMCDYGDYLALGIHEGKLQKWHKRKNTIETINSPDVHYKVIRTTTFFDGNLWVGTHSGLFIIDELQGKTVSLKRDPLSAYLLSDNVVEKIYKDREGGIWVATNFGGINYLPNYDVEFERYTSLSNGNSISSQLVRDLIEDKKGNIWIATEDAGMDILSPSTKTFRKVKMSSGFNRILTMMLSGEDMWVGFFKNGLDVIGTSGLGAKHYSGNDLGLDEHSIYALYEDRLGNIWLGNAWGVFVGDKVNRKFTRIDDFGLSFVMDITEDADGNIWVATMGNGIFRYTPSTQKMAHFLHDSKNSKTLSSNSVSSITETVAGDMWFATDRGGVCRFNKDSNTFTSISLKDGLPDDCAYKILEDKNQNLWFGTNKGLVKFNPKTKEVKVFTKNDGLPSNQFNYKSGLSTAKGRLYFGTLGGLVSFDPYQIGSNTYAPPVYITKLSIYNKDIAIGGDDSPLNKSVIHTDKITLSYKQSNISFQFVALSYTASKANLYAYKMEGIDKDWIYTPHNQSASYANLKPGNYVFKVMGSNNDGVWNETGATLEIEILPPWWLSGWAIIVYSILLLILIYYIFYWYKQRTDRRQYNKQRLFESEKEKELYRDKVDFFTNIAHEIRTPVTLICGPLESMLEMDIQEPELVRNLKMMSKNTSELLDLTNHLLDFRKVDSRKFVVNKSSVNVAALVRETFAKFEVLSKQQNKEISLTLSDDNIYTLVDKPGFTKILNNLFSNAIKYSDKKIEINLSTESDIVILDFKNDGYLIPLELKEKIFDPFYQIEKNVNTQSSSGVGLSLARSLAELHGGSLYYEQTDGFNRFVLKIPLFTSSEIGEGKEQEDGLNDYVVEEMDPRQDAKYAETVLIVEDNEEMLSFISGKLSEYFAIEKVRNGKEAITVLEERSVNLVLSDVMMPEMDGFELCKYIKGNAELSHIPVVLLTAKNDLDSKIHGLEMGADVYIEKPFSISYLVVQLNTLLDNRQREKDAFMRKPFLPIQHIGMNKANEQFLENIIDAIHENITDTNFNVERLAEIACMSRSSLHRKLKALVDLSPVDFIRFIRLKKAAELIQNGDYRIAEVGYLVGINSSSYFIKLFSKQFGMTPKEFEKQQKEKF